MIISRYLKKEVTSALLAVTFVLLLIFLSDRLVRYLSYAAAGKIPASLLFQLMGYEVPYYLALLLPLGLYLGIILVYSRLYADNELWVMQACGLTLRQLLSITGTLACAIAIIVLVLMLWVNPMLASAKSTLLSRQAGTGNLINTLVPGSFRVVGDNVVYVEKIARNHRQADNIFIAEKMQISSEEGQPKWMIVSAAHGEQTRDAVTQQRYVVAKNGYRYDGIPGQGDYKVIRFGKYALRLPDEAVVSKRQEQEAIPTATLFRHYHHPDAAAELQWRLSIGILPLVLALFAVPLSQIRPRQGRYAMLLPAILLYIVYANLLFVARNLIEQKYILFAIGMWWVHGIMLLLLIIFLLLHTGWWRRFFR